MQHFVSEYKQQFDEGVAFFREDISSLRTGRATPALVEDVQIEAYGMRQPLKAVASIGVLDAKTLQVEPWDKSITIAVESGLRASNLGFNPVNDGKVIRIPLPELTADRRQDLLKVLSQKMEQAKIAVRQNREDIKKQIERTEKDGEMSEDDKYKLMDELEKMVKGTNERIAEIAAEKEKEITTI
jgi:ribosome recycling factor